MVAMVNRGLLTINKDAFQYITEHLEATSQMTLYKIMALYRILGEQGGHLECHLRTIFWVITHLYSNRYSNSVYIGYDNVLLYGPCPPLPSLSVKK